jgi:hypothetical protein
MYNLMFSFSAPGFLVSYPTCTEGGDAAVCLFGTQGLYVISYVVLCALRMAGENPNQLVFLLFIPIVWAIWIGVQHSLYLNSIYRK